MDAKPVPDTYAAPAPGAGVQDGPAGSYPLFASPVAVLVARGFQLFLAFVILVLSGLLIHGLALDAVVFALVCDIDSSPLLSFAFALL